VSASTAHGAEVEGTKGMVTCVPVYSIVLSNGNHPITSVLLIHHKAVLFSNVHKFYIWLVQSVYWLKPWLPNLY